MMRSQLSKLRNDVSIRQGKQIRMQEERDRLVKQLHDNRKNLQDHKKALEIIRAIGIATQKELETNIADTVTKALQSIFPNPYSMVVSFTERRNQSECDLMLQRNGHLIKPLGNVSGGVVNVIGFVLRMMALSFQSPPYRNILILDEPFRDVSRNYIPALAQFLRRCCDDLGVQIIMSTHVSLFKTMADTYYQFHFDKQQTFSQKLERKNK